MAVYAYREGQSDLRGAVVAVVADIGAARGYRASGSSRRVTYQARRCRCCSCRRRTSCRSRRRGWTGRRCWTHRVSIGVGILLRLAVDRVASVHPRSDVLGEYRGAVVVVARVERLDARVALQRQRTDYIRGRFVSQPGHAVIGRLPGMHLVAKIAGTRGLTAGRCPWCLVIPRGEESASFADREVGHPLGLGRIGVGVQLEGRTEGHAAVGGADVVDVAGVAAIGLSIDEANYVVESGRLTPAHVTPVSGAAVHTGKVARISAVRALEGGPGVSIGPGVAPVSGAIDQIVAGKVA